MFTGIVTDRGTVIVRRDGTEVRLRIAGLKDSDNLVSGASVACDGCCLTVVDRGWLADGSGWFDVDVSPETMARTTLGDWREGRQVNLERSLKLGDELGGHFVLGHVDGVGTVTGVAPDGDSARWQITAPGNLARFIAPKGSIVVDGVSLTVNSVGPETGTESGTGAGGNDDDSMRFGVTIIPHTAAVTGFGAARPGDRVNLEVDALARYVARLLDREAG